MNVANLKQQKADLQAQLHAQKEILTGNAHWVDAVGKNYGETHSANIADYLEAEYGVDEADSFRIQVAKYDIISEQFWNTIDQLIEAGE